jgi:acyl-CoA thioesterase FadM
MIDRIRFARVTARALVGERMGILDTSSLEFRAGLSDIDINLHITNSQYLRIMDLGRTDYFVRSGLAKAAWDLRAGPVVGAAAIRYKAEIRPGERYRLDTRVIGWDDKWFYCDQRFVIDGRDRAIGVVKFLFHAGAEKFSPARVLDVHRDDAVESPLDAPSIAGWADSNGL